MTYQIGGEDDRKMLRKSRRFDAFGKPTDAGEFVLTLATYLESAFDALEQTQVRREELANGREHLTVTNEFQSDKYPWCPAGFVPLKVTDPMATTLLRVYAARRRVVDKEFSRDLEEALLYAGGSNHE